MKRLLAACCLAVVLAPMTALAAVDGNYVMDDGTMKVEIKFMTMPDGKLFVDANGTSTGGKTCRIGDLGILSGNNLVLGGLCSIPITATADGFAISVTPSCVQCDQGAYLQGTYKRVSQ